MVYVAEVKVYVWHKEKLVGHASMDIKGSDDSRTYVSYWPSELKKEIKHLWRTTNNRMVESYEEDCSEIGRSADTIITIYNLHTSHSIAFYKNRWQGLPYNLVKTNCCVVVIDNLNFMSGIENTSPQSWHPVWSPQDVISYAKLLKSKAFPKPLIIDGTVEYTINGSNVEIRVDKIVNNRNSGTSRTLKLQFWAIKSPYNGGNIDGHVFAETQLEALKSGDSYSDIKRSVTYNRPSARISYVVTTLHEYDNNDEWPIYDWVNLTVWM